MVENLSLAEGEISSDFQELGTKWAHTLLWHHEAGNWLCSAVEYSEAWNAVDPQDKPGIQ